MGGSSDICCTLVPLVMMLTCMAQDAHAEEMLLADISLQPLSVMRMLSNGKAEIANSSSIR